MIVLGVDPGKRGAIARIGHSVEIQPMPLITSARGRDEYDLQAIRELLTAWADPSISLVAIERSQPMPPKMKGGSIASFHRGVARGWEWMCAGMGIPYLLVAPAMWMREMHAGTPGADTKQRSILAAQRLFPSVDFRRSPRAKKQDDAMAEALLIAEFARRHSRGGG